ncbi:MAG: metallopeptidase TldD-related protein [Bacteroidales bacterium]|jgi:hypothetical protein
MKTIVFLMFTFSLVSGKDQLSSDSVIFHAMKDELNRNIRHLSAKEYDDPFFIAYTIADAKNTIVNATLGAIYTSETRDYKDWQVRVMVGDYEINDENFNYDQPQENIYRPSIEMPVENDYEGIRRSLWLTTNNVYNSAAQSYKTKIDLINHKKLDESDLQINDFSRAPVVNIKIPSPEVAADQEQIEQFVRDLSAVFKQYPEIYISDVGCNVFRSTVYFINSEGTEVKFPFNLSSLVIKAGTMTDDGEKIHRQITYAFRTPDELPDLKTVTGDVKTLIDNLIVLNKAERFEDDYSGPVLILGQAVAETMEKILFGGTDQLIASRESLQSSSQMNLYYDKNNNSLEPRIGKLILAKDLTITAEPTLKEYNGIPLIGSYQVDAEGVVPPGKLTLVENGILKTLLNGRTPSRNVPESNGHMRFSYGYGGIVKQIGPGVIKVTSSAPLTVESLKTMLIEKAKEEGLDYGVIIRSMNVGGAIKSVNLFKISTKTGEEEIIRSVRIKPPSLITLKRHLGVSGNLQVHNTILSMSGDRNFSSLVTGMPVSFIVPDALLLEDIELESINKPLTSLLPVIENPVGSGESGTGNNNEE